MHALAITVFLVSALGLFYLVIGFPLLLGWWAARWNKPVRRHLEWKTVTVLLPVHNGKPWIREKLESILGLDYPQDLIQVLVISDASDDGTDEIVESFAPRGVRLIRVERGGKALALNAGMEQATGDILFFTDVRQRLEPSSLKSLVACLGDPEVGVVSGE
jgi:cellulose synthase/poly-beta-1,6-N-acetylglucosamine synthase-like glycosyltransferase